MARQDLTNNVQSRTTTTYFVGLKAPTPITDPNGQVIGWNPGTGYTQTDVNVGTFARTSGYRQSVNTVGFRSPKRPYLLRSNSFTLSRSDQQASGYNSVQTLTTNVTNAPGSAGYTSSMSYSENVMQYAFAPDDSSSWVSQLRDKAASQLLNALRNSSFNAAQAIAERKQTADLFTSTAKKVASAFGSLRKGNFVRAAQDLGVIPKKRAGRRFNKDFPIDQAKAVGNAWLELQYGWKPLLADVYGSMETLARANNPATGNANTIFKKMSGRAKRIESPYVRTDHLAGQSGPRGVWLTIASATVECYVRYGVTYSVSSPALTSLASVGITNPALLAWELLPYSFVVDWFLPIGNYLGSLDATNGLVFQDGYVTVMRKYNGTVSSSKSYSYNGTGYGGFVQQSRKTVEVIRTPIGGFPAMPFPSFKNPLSSSHAASAMSLLLQTFKR